jgi:Protein of unknown function (DUF4244)
MGDIVLQRIRVKRAGSWGRAVVADPDEIEVAEADQPVSSPDHSAVQPNLAAGMSDAGMSTVEYAVGTVVAAAFAAVLYKIVTGDSVIAGLTNLINTALDTTF